MKRFRTLQFRLSALVFAFGLLVIAVTFVRHYVHDAGSQLEQMKRGAYTEGVRLAGLGQHLMRRHLTQAADLATSYASLDPNLLLGVICDGTDLIQHATEKQWSGVPLEKSPLANVAPLLKVARESMEERIETVDDGKRLVGAFPFWDFSQGIKKGVVVLDYNLATPLHAARNRMIRESLVQACALLGACMLFWSVLQLLVTERVLKIVEQTQQIDWDGASASAVQGDDELAFISGSFAESVARLRKSEKRFSQIAASMRDVFWIAPKNSADHPYVNAAYARLTRRSERSLETRRWDWLHSIAKEDRSKALEMLRTLRRSPSEGEVEVRILDKESNARWMCFRGFSAETTHGADGPLQVAGVAMDITERKEVESRVLEAAEHERRRIGQDLHDDVCQRLSAAQLKSGVLEAALRRGAFAQAGLDGVRAKANAEATDLARRYAKGLAPVAMGASAMSGALEDLSTFLERAFGVKCVIAADDLEGVVDANQAAQIYRIVQELATNAARHAGSSVLHVSVTHAEDEIHLRVENDGRYFDPSMARRKGGMGLHVLQQRVDALGASLQYSPRSSGENGTIAICEIPLDHDILSKRKESHEKS